MTYVPKLTLKKMFKQFRTIIKHKNEVFKTCWIAGMPIVGLTHDLSKFHPTEFLESAAWQIDGRSPVTHARDTQGYSLAYIHHMGHNPHHWEHWMQHYRKDGVQGVKIPFRYLKEMFCDHIAAGIAYDKAGGPKWSESGAYDWWANLKSYAPLHPETEAMLETWYSMLLTEGRINTLKSLKTFKNKY